MSIQRITLDEFESHDVARMMPASERAWFKDSESNILGVVVRDSIDKDWSWVILAKDEDRVYRCIDVDSSLPSQDEAELVIMKNMSSLEAKGFSAEDLYTTEPNDEDKKSQSIIITDIDLEVKKYFKNHPDELYKMDPRRFEILVASILKDMGFDIELTKATRDGGVDIIARVKTAVCEFLTFVECKRYAPDNKVDVGIVRQVIGVHNIRQASKSIIVTSSFYTKDAVIEAKKVESQIELKDYEDIKSWLSKY